MVEPARPRAGLPIGRRRGRVGPRCFTAELQRVGGVLVAVREDRTQVVGLLHQQAARLDGIADAVGGVAGCQAGLAHSLSALHHRSMVGLGSSIVRTPYRSALSTKIGPKLSPM